MTQGTDAAFDSIVVSGSLRLLTNFLAVLRLVACASPSIPQTAASRSTAPPSADVPSSAAAASLPAASETAVSGGASNVHSSFRPRSGEAGDVPSCADPSSSLCLPPPDFVDLLCAKPRQDAALALFAKATPFARMYLRGTLDELRPHEEVLALRYHEVSKNGIRVGNSVGSYDVLRWDGSCSMAVDAEMVSRIRPPHPRVARVQWHRLSENVQQALVAGSSAVQRAHSRRGKECLGAMSGDVSAACEKADAALVDAIVEYVRSGGLLPAPEASTP